MASINSKTRTRHRILVVAADRETTSWDLLQEEVSTIDVSFGEAGVTRPIIDAVQPANQDKLTETVSQFRPTIVHFTGHGNPSGRVIFEDKRGWLRNVTGVTVARTVVRLTPRLQCLVLSGCRVSRELPFLRFVAEKVISVSNRSDGVDITPVVSKSLYQGIGQGTGYRHAFDLVKSKLKELELLESVHTNFYQGAEPSAGVLQRLLVEYYGGAFQQPSGHVASELEFKSAPSAGLGFMIEKALPSKPQQGSARKQEEGSGPRMYRVWFGTNREPLDTANITKGFGAERSDEVRYGYCDVSVPKYHVIGSVGDPWWKRFPRFWRNNRLAVCTLMPLPEGEYWKSIRAVFDGLTKDDRVLLIFVHGYNVNFYQAVIRTAQLGVDLGIRGATGLFSWPSKGLIVGYPADVAAIEASEQKLGDFIIKMANQTGAANVHLIAHSMGNLGLLRAFTTVVDRIAQSLKVPLSQIILAAPDVDVDLFKRLATAYVSISTRTTMYVSGLDKALRSSGVIRDYPRAGFTPPVTVVNGIDTVEVTNIDLTFLGHGYVAEVERVLQDMKVLMEVNLPPPRRFGLEECSTSASDVYWKMKR